MESQIEFVGFNGIHRDGRRQREQIDGAPIERFHLRRNFRRSCPRLERSADNVYDNRSPRAHRSRPKLGCQWTLPRLPHCPKCYPGNLHPHEDLHVSG